MAKKVITPTVQNYHRVGKRKRSVARVYLRESSDGKGSIRVNKRGFEDYFPRETARMMIVQPLELTKNLGRFDIKVNVRGGGLSGQAGAVRHGITRSLLEVDASYRSVLKKAGLITRDSREVERKKYGMRGARARFQFSKR